jgi:ribonuclease D
MARFMMKKFILDLRPLFDTPMATRTARFPMTINLNKTNRKTTCAV